MAAGYPRPTQEGGVARTARCRRMNIQCNSANSWRQAPGIEQASR
jgi:hypothetical protein